MSSKVTHLIDQNGAFPARAGRGLRNQLTQRAGEHFVAAEINRRGAIATPFSGNMPGIDIIAFDASRQREVYVQVKTKTKSKFIWHMSVPDKKIREPKDEKEFFVFVDLGTGSTASPGYWIAPRSWVENAVYKGHHAWLKKIGGVRPRNASSRHSAIKENDIAKWKDRWDVLAIDVRGQ